MTRYNSLNGLSATLKSEPSLNDESEANSQAVLRSRRSLSPSQSQKTRGSRNEELYRAIIKFC